MSDTLPERFASVDDVVASLSAMEQRYLATRDRRGIFVTAYLDITRAIAEHADAGGFEDADWVRRYLVCFANFYRQAVVDDAAAQPGAVPKAWRIAFELADAGEGFVLQHLVLGINAHINHDLALALAEVGIDDDRAGRYADHTQVNAVLADAAERMKYRVGQLYEPLLHRLDRLAGNIDERLINFSIPKAREHAWSFAVALSAAGEGEQPMLRRTLDDQAAVLARLVITSPTRHPWVTATVAILRRIDRAWRHRFGR